MRKALLVPLSLLVGCGGGGGGSGGGTPSTPAPPAYQNGTTTGQFTNNDLGFYLGAETDPESPTTADLSPKLKWDIGNGWMETKTNIKWRVLRDGALFASGTIPSLASLAVEHLEVPVTPGAGTRSYRIEIDYTNDFTETNENNNWVVYQVSIAPAAPG